MSKRKSNNSSRKGLSENQKVINKLRYDNFIKTQSIIDSLNESTGDVEVGNSVYYRDNESLTGYSDGTEDIPEEYANIDEVEVTERSDNTNQCILKITQDRMEIYLRDYDDEISKYNKANNQFINSLVWLINLLISSGSLTYATTIQDIGELALNSIVEEHLLYLIILLIIFLLYIATVSVFVWFIISLIRKLIIKEPNSSSVIAKMKKRKSFNIT